MERYRKAVVAVLGVALLYAGIVFDVLGESDLSTTEGIIAAAVALATALGVYQVPNVP